MPALINCPVSKAVEEDEEEKKSCGVRGRRMKTVAGKRRQRLCSTEEASPEHAHNMATEYCSETEGPQRTLSHDSTDSEHERKTSCNTDPVETKTHCDDDLENDVFFPELSPTNSTDSSLVEGDDGTGRREKRQRLSSCDSRSSSLSCQSCVIETGETMADMILPTIFPPSRRRSRNINSSTEGITHCLATFHEHKLRCVELEGEQYVLLEELLAKCFPGLPRDKVEIARLRDLNLLTKTVHLLGSGLAGDNGDSVSVLALSDAGRLLHFFHGMMHCPGTDCLLRASPKARTDSRDSEPSPSQSHDSEEGASVTLHRSESSGFAITGKADKGSRRYSNQSEEGGSGENEGPEDTHSCSSDRTFPYCDGQPMTYWEEESLAKTENSTSDGEQNFSPITTTHSVSLKFRRHFSDSEGRAQKLRDYDGPHRGYHQSSPDVFSPDEVSAMLPPLPTYIASPFTSNSMYNVPMDNERVLLECFSAPGSQAPSSVRSAPSVRLPSPDHHDLPHLDEDVFEGLANYKLVADHDATHAKEYFHSKQIVTPVFATKGAEVEQFEDHIIDNKSGVDVTGKKNSIDNHYYDFADDYDLTEFEDTFADANIKSTGDIGHSRMFDRKQENLDIVPKVAVSEKSLDTHNTCARFKKYSKGASYTPCKTVCENYGTKTAIAFPSSLAERQLLQKHEIESLKEKLNLRKVREKEAQMAKDLGHKLNSVIASRRETSEHEDDKYENSLVILKAPFSPKSETQIHPKEELSDNDDRSSLANSARSCVSDDSLLEVSPNSPKSSSGTVKTFCEDPALVIQRKSSGTTIAYGASDDEAEDVLSTETAEKNSATGRLTQALLHSQNSTGPPELSTAHGSVQTNNSPHTSPPRIEPITIDTSFTFLDKTADSKSGNVEQETDEIRLPSGCEGSLEDRVQEFIAQGSQFTPRPVIRSNSLPDLCGAETLASPVRDCEEIPTYRPGAITSRTRSYPGASDVTKQQHSGRWDDQSPVALPLTRLSESVKVFDEEQDSSKPAETAAASTPPRGNERTDLTDTDAPALETEEAVFVDPTDVLDVVEVSTRATPRRSPQVAGDCEDQFFEWAVPCAAHGSVFCSCECVDVQTVSEVAASPKVGPWLCTPGTPAPGTPFCDYSKLIYSPFPVEAGMTPARPDTADAPVGSPKLTSETVTCGVKRQAPSGGQPAPKRRSLSPSAPSGEAGKSCDRVEIRTNGSGADFKDSYVKDTESDSVHKEELLLRSAELELITAAEESEKDIAVVPDEDKVHPQTLPDDIYECTEHNNAGVRLSKETEERDSCWDPTDETMHNALLSAAEKSEEHLSAACGGSLSRLKTYTITDTATNASDTAQLLSPPHTLNSSDTSACENGRDKSSQPGVDTDNSDCLGAEVSANLNADPHDESSLYSSEQHSLSISKPFDQVQTESKHMEVHSIKDETDSASAHADFEGARQPSEDTNTVDSLNDMGKPATRKANHKLSPNAPASPDAPSLGTAESETTDDERIISLGEFMESDMEITSLEDPEDSRDSTESRLSPKPSPEPELERSTSSKSKKTLTIAQYRARRRQNQSNSDSSSSEEPKEYKTIDSNTDLLVRSDSQNQTQQEEQSDSECSEKAAPEVSPESMLSARLPLIVGEFPPKMRRTESVPSEPSRRPTVHLKRSSSFHGQHPASKRFRQEGDLRVELKVSKKKGEEAGDTQSS
ncbi:serine-rich adhesin for platelets-like [Littorina saxatilis]|uniref:serine-rich adhesin for platelets-like n=1 Tax=Littorina saxatilis TaxID=31220 RepID=UPI0038B56912